MFRLAALFLAIPLAAQAQDGKWSIGVYGASPALSGHYMDDEAGTSISLKDDFKLNNDGMGFGFHFEYSGPRLGFSLQYSSFDYSGRNLLTKSIRINGEEYGAGYEVASGLSHSLLEALVTYKLLKGGKGWLGVDLGMQSWTLDMTAEGFDTQTNPAAPKGESFDYAEKFTAPIPFFGASCGVKAMGGRLELGAKYHLVSYSGASYTRFGADARYFVMPWLGLRAFLDNQSFKAPEDSILDSVDAKLDRNSFGFGVVAKF
jgi:hypothetical protein